MLTLKTERQFHSFFVKMAREYGWHVAQFRPARTMDGEWRTPVGADGKGYPDFTLVRERIFWAELKGERGSLRPEQKVWIEKLRAAGAEVYVWKPRHLDEIREILRPLSPRGERLVEACGGNGSQAYAVERMIGGLVVKANGEITVRARRRLVVVLDKMEAQQSEIAYLRVRNHELQLMLQTAIQELAIAAEKPPWSFRRDWLRDHHDPELTRMRDLP